MACAHAGGDGAGGNPGTDRATAQRLYTVAEDRYAAGAYDEAVALMRHSLLQLPPEPEHDGLRHQLVLRMAHTQLMWFAASGHPAPLQDAQQLLTRYVERHEQLFGESEAALLERGQVYELLYQVEKQLEPFVVDAAGEADESQVLVATASTSATVPAEVPPAPEAPTEAVTIAPEPDDAPAITTTRRTEDDGSEVRDVVVHEERRIASLDDPRVKERLRSPFSTGWLGGALTAYGVTKMRDARALVRGYSRLAGDGDLSQQLQARRTGQSLLHLARQDLRECYASAYARLPIDALDSEIEASVHPDGSVSHVRIVEGGLVDGYGDACLIEALQSTVLAPLDEATEPVRVQVALRFFYEGALYINELTGEQVHEGGIMLSPGAPRLDGLPSVEESSSLGRDAPRRRPRQ